MISGRLAQWKCVDMSALLIGRRRDDLRSLMTLRIEQIEERRLMGGEIVCQENFEQSFADLASGNLARPRPAGPDQFVELPGRRFGLS